MNEVTVGQFLKNPIETSNKLWLNNCDIDMLQFGLLKSPFVYLSLILIMVSIVSTVSIYIGKKIKLKSSYCLTKKSIKASSSTSSMVKLCYKCRQLLSDKNGNMAKEQLNPVSENDESITEMSSESKNNSTCQVDCCCSNFSSNNSTFTVSQSSPDLKPFLLILNGFLFGIFGVGIPIVYVCTQSGYDMFSCDATPSVDDVKTKAVKHLGMVYLVIMLSDFIYPLTCLLRLPSINSSQRQSSSVKVPSLTRNYWMINLQLAHVTFWLILQLLEIIVYPGGFSIFTGFMIMIHRTYFYGYLVMTTASKAVSPKSLRTKWRNGLIWTQFISTLAICLHHIYFNSLAPASCGNKTVLTSTAIYCTISSIFFGANLLIDQLQSKNKTN